MFKSIAPVRQPSISSVMVVDPPGRSHWRAESAFRFMNILKRWRVLPVFLVAALCCTSAAGQSRRLDTTTFIVMGEGLAAGMANYGLSAVVQQYSFPAQMAAQMNTTCEQPLIQPPGIGDNVGYPPQEVRLQAYPQGAVRGRPARRRRRPHRFLAGDDGAGSGRDRRHRAAHPERDVEPGPPGGHVGVRPRRAPGDAPVGVTVGATRRRARRRTPTRPRC